MFISICAKRRDSYSVIIILLLVIQMMACDSVDPETSAITTTASSKPPAATTLAPTQTLSASSKVPDPRPTDVPGNWWQPGLITSWQWQLADPPVDQSFDVEMYDIDLFDNDTAIVAELHEQGRVVICYLNAGGWEDWRPDAAQFPASIIGQNLDGWTGEKWLDIRRLDLLGPVLEARLDLCRDKGFDGVEPDNVDGYLNETGFPLTYQDQLAFNIWLAEEAHQRGLSIGLKNDMEQIADLLPYFDWALNEQCFEYEECDTLLPFIQAGKPVFNVEYHLDTAEFCRQANTLNFNSLKKNLEVDAYREACR